MKIVFIFERKIIATAGGVERVTILLAEEMERRGHEVCFLSVGPESWNEELYSGEFKQYYIPSEKPDFIEKIKQFFREETIDVVIIQGHHHSVLPVLKEIPQSVSRLMVFHNQPYAVLGKDRYVKRLTPWNSLKLKGKFLKLLALTAPVVFRELNRRELAQKFNYLIDNINRFVLLSDRYIPRMIAYTPGINKTKLIAINNPNTFQVSETDNIFEKENIVLFVGRLSNPQKNVLGFLRVWKEFYKRHPDWKALIVGDGKHRAIVEKEIKTLKLRNISLEGARDNMDDYYKRSKMLCMTSTYEGWPMVLAEAMAYRCVPVVYDSFEAIYDIINSEENGMIVPSFKVHQMVTALGKLASDNQFREVLADNGQNTIQAFTVDKIVDQWERLLEEIEKY